MDGIIRRLRTQELTARILLYELEHSALTRQLRSSKTSTGRRAEIHRRLPHLKFELWEAINDLRWLEAEERLSRPVTKRLICRPSVHRPLLSNGSHMVNNHGGMNRFCENLKD